VRQDRDEQVDGDRTEFSAFFGHPNPHEFFGKMASRIETSARISNSTMTLDRERLGPMKFEVWAQTDVGLKRDNNQDAILVDHDLHLYIVADGMGGHRGGEVASGMAVEAVQDIIRRRSKDAKVAPRKALADAYREASLRIFQKSSYENPELMGMGTTMVLMWIQKDRIFIGNVGDSRAYLFRSPNLLWQLTEDHSLINEQVKAGVISEEEAPHVLGRNVITRSVGFEKEVIVDVLERDPAAEDLYLLCSDGLSALVENDKIAEILHKYAPAEAISKLIKEAKAAGGDDNISVILIKVISVSGPAGRA
jgi:protein phosphatase